jgi:DNA repair protein RadC
MKSSLIQRQLAVNSTIITNTELQIQEYKGKAKYARLRKMNAVAKFYYKEARLLRSKLAKFVDVQRALKMELKHQLSFEYSFPDEDGYYY